MNLRDAHETNLDEQMDDAGVGIETARTAPEDVAKKEKSQRDARIRKAANDVVKARRVIAGKMIEIAELIEKAKLDLPPGQVRSFALQDCQIGRDELRTFLKIGEMPEADKAVVHQSRFGYSALKTLLSTGDAARKEALRVAAGGTPVSAAGIRRIDKSMKRADETFVARAERRRRAALRSSVRQKSATAFDRFQGDLDALMECMTPFFLEQFDDQNQAQMADRLQALARSCVTSFEALVDVASLPPAWEHGFYNKSHDPVLMAEAYHALQALAAGEFKQWDDIDHRPLFEDYGIDEPYYEAIAWLAGRHEETRVADQMLSRVPAAPKGELLVRPPSPLVSLEICAGAGGQSLGLHEAGFKSVALYERDPNAVKTLRKHPHTLEDRVHHSDVREVSFKTYKGRVDLVAGGVPCQGFSAAGKHKGKDDERDLFLEAVRLVDEVRPRAFFFENVANFAQAQHADYRRDLHQLFEDLGYENRVFKMMGSDFGLAQGRPRIAFIGFRDGEMSRFRMPPTLPGLKKSLAAEIGDLVSQNGWKGLDDWLKMADRLAPTIVGGSERSKRLDFSSNYTKDAWEMLGINPRKIAKSAPAEDHECLIGLTMRMGARLQNFPDDYEFQGPLDAQKRQIANALPPVMAKAVGLAIYSALTGVEFDYEAALADRIRTPAVQSFRSEAGKLNLNSSRAQEIHIERVFFGEERFGEAELDAFDAYDAHELSIRSQPKADA